jgi:sugar phosphate isomerase/epimerase
MPRRPPPTDEDLLAWVKGNDAFDGLIAIRRLRVLLNENEHRHVSKARDYGLPWYVIGMWLGVSAQGVHKRWARTIRRENELIDLLEELEADECHVAPGAAERTGEEPRLGSPVSPIPSTKSTGGQPDSCTPARATHDPG